MRHKCTKCKKEVERPGITTWAMNTGTKEITKMLCDKCDKEFTDKHGG